LLFDKANHYPRIQVFAIEPTKNTCVKTAIIPFGLFYNFKRFGLGAPQIEPAGSSENNISPSFW